MFLMVGKPDFMLYTIYASKVKFDCDGVADGDIIMTYPEQLQIDLHYCSQISMFPSTKVKDRNNFLLPVP